jgi:hypothetical protein
MLVVETRVHDEERCVVFHKIVRLEQGKVDPDSYRAFEQQVLHPWESDFEMKRIA